MDRWDRVSCSSAAPVPGDRDAVSAAKVDTRIFRPEMPGDLTCSHGQSHACVIMHLETKFLRLKTPVTIGSRFEDWQVCWLGGWTRHRLSYIVMVVRVLP
jgi:hypothetical protein